MKRQSGGSLTNLKTTEISGFLKLILQKHKNYSYLVEIPKSLGLPTKTNNEKRHTGIQNDAGT